MMNHLTSPVCHGHVAAVNHQLALHKLLHQVSVAFVQMSDPEVDSEADWAADAVQMSDPEVDPEVDWAAEAVQMSDLEVDSEVEWAAEAADTNRWAAEVAETTRVESARVELAQVELALVEATLVQFEAAPVEVEECLVAGLVHAPNLTKIRISRLSRLGYLGLLRKRSTTAWSAQFADG